MGLYDFTFYDLINRNAVCHKDKPAWFEADDGRSLTFDQFRETVNRVACGLQNSGIRKGDRIGVLGKNCLEYFLIYGAASALGAIVLPLNWRLSPEEVVYNLNDCRPKALFVESDYQDMVENQQEELSFVRNYYNLKIEGGSFEDLEQLLDNDGEIEFTDVSSDDGFVIIHTAAVAGQPRGALLSHGNMLCANMHLNYLFNLNETDIHLNLLPLFHVGGLFMASNSFHAGALNINMSRFDATRAVELIEEHGITVMFDFSPILSAILGEHEKSGKRIDSLQSVLGLDTADTIEKYQKLTGGTFYCMYGQTETSCLASFGKYNDRPESAGKVIPMAEVILVDDEDEAVEPGETGEIVMKGPMVFQGYWDLPEENEEVFRNGWHHTGDLGRFDEDGFLWYVGRKAEKELIKPGGENVYPVEVENAILQHPAISQAVVIGVPDKKWKEGIKAVCVLKPGKRLKSKELIRYVGKRIASYKKPQYVEFAKDLPTLTDGTHDREAIKELYGGPQD